MKIDYSNMPQGSSKYVFQLRYWMNVVRTWWLFHVKYPWVKYDGFVRVMSHTRFAKRRIKLGNNVQFGKYCSIATDIMVGNDVLFAGRVCCVGKNDHITDIVCKTIWESPRGIGSPIIINNDVWIGNGVTLMNGITIGDGSVIAAGAVVTHDVPSCEVWGGTPARKIKDRFHIEADKLKHLEYLHERYTKS